MSSLQNVPVSQMREALAAWRGSEMRPRLWGPPKPLRNQSHYDRMADLIDEIERLRSASPGVQQA